MPVDVAARKAKIEAKRQRRSKGTGIEWNMTNIGAALCLMGFFLLLFIFLDFMINPPRILTILSIPAVIFIIIGYALIVKDHFDNQKIQRAMKKKKASSEEE